MSSENTPFSRDNAPLKKLGIAFFYDERGQVDDYFFHLIQNMAKFTNRHILVCNGAIQEQYLQRFRGMQIDVITRENIGFDVWAYKTALETIGLDAIADFDEVLLYNHTFYGPIYPFEEMFFQMDARSCDFWGITSHKAMTPNPFTGKDILPRHLNSHFIAVRRRMLSSEHFKRYWSNMPMIRSYIDSILTHESRFTTHFEELGFQSSVYIDDTNYSSDYPAQTNIDEVLEDRCPILKRRIFFHDPIMHESNAIDLPRALRIMRSTSNYDEGLIWPNILRTADIRTLNTTAALTSVLPDVRLRKHARVDIKRVAVCAHVYYVDMVEELLELCENIPEKFDFIVTTDTPEKAVSIRAACSTFSKIENLEIKILEVNRGRDMSALFITCRDLFLSDNYDVVCRLHTKKSPQVESSRSNTFKRHMFENLLNSEGYVENVLDMFEEKPWVGLAVPPAVHISYSTLGHGWFTNKPKAVEEAAKLGIHVKFDTHTPIAAYGTMFWFRPKALKALFRREWRWDEFNEEPHHIDGGLAHALERLIAYAAQNEGYTTEQILCCSQASYNYAMLEFKHSELSCNIGRAFHEQVWMMRQWQLAGNPLSRDHTQSQPLPEFAFRAAWYEDKDLMLPRDKLLAEEIATALDHDPTPAKIVQRHAGLFKAVYQRGSTFDEDVNIVINYLDQFEDYALLFDRAELRVRAEEYLASGWMNGNDLFALFDTAFYLDRYPDVASSELNPFIHYINHGASEKRQPHPLFDPEYYLTQTKGVEDHSELVPFFVKNGFSDRASPHPLFSMDFYYLWHRDVYDSRCNALCHYIKFGASEKRKPHLLFDVDYYDKCIGQYLSKGTNHLLHFIKVGSRLGISPHILFDMEFYCQQVKGGLLVQDSLTHYLTSHSTTTANPHPLFDTHYYKSNCADIGERKNPLEHFCGAIRFDNAKPHPFFDSEKYLAMHPSVARAGINPLLHYVKHGVFEQLDVPGFDAEGYLESSNLTEADVISPFVHFIKYRYYNAADGENQVK